MSGFTLVWGGLGLVIGYFLSVVINRFSAQDGKEQSIFCQMSPSFSYLLVMIVTGLVYLGIAWVHSGLWSISFLMDLIFVSFLIILSFIDLNTFRLPDNFVLPLLGVSLVAALLGVAHTGRWDSLTSGGVAAGVFLLIARFYPDGLGLGDVKLVTALGVYLGFPSVLLALFFASLSGTLIGGTVFFLRKRSFRGNIPFGPFLALGAMVALMWNEQIFGAYLALFR